MKNSGVNQYEKVLVIEGESLNLILEQDKIGFLQYCLLHSFVCIARCSPLQKYQITSIIKEELGLKVLCVGDGGNDVGMIQASNIGIGVLGREGNQAALSADFVLEKFQDLAKLLLFYG